MRGRAADGRRKIAVDGDRRYFELSGHDRTAALEHHGSLGAGSTGRAHRKPGDVGFDRHEL